MIKDDTTANFEETNLTEEANLTECDNEEPCESRIIKTKTMPCCANKCMPPHARTPYPFVAKVPVVKKICCVNINVKSFIKLEKCAEDIKDIDKDVCITQCTLCPIHTPYMEYKWVKYQLFLEGYVKKNIRYSYPTCEAEGKRGCVSGKVLFTTCKIPFECSTTIILPNSCKKNLPSFQEKFETLDKTKLCRDYDQQHLMNYENFVEVPYCELVNSVISECDFVKTPRVEGKFKKLEEKMVVSVTLRVLQNEEMCIKPGRCRRPCGYGKHDKYEEYDKQEEYEKGEEYDREEEYEKHEDFDE
ncbi:hypothetical protein SH2C18_18110 [Clostridium sediminicola]|uniref:CsxC family protein n=1 Tax=Clostridium sediminicola TaxID=3114879 RepID=UPI0031F23EF7